MPKRIKPEALVLMHINKCVTPLEVSNEMRAPRQQFIIKEISAQQMMSALNSLRDKGHVVYDTFNGVRRYHLTEKGRARVAALSV